jgi:hypothetical protein
MTALLFITFCFFSTYWNLSVDFSSTRGFYDKPFSLTLTSDGSIVYTISISTADRTSPTATDTSVTGTQYTTPINIQRTCIIRSLAYIKVGNKLTNISKMKIHTFIFLSDVVKQSILNQDVVTNYASSMVAAFTNIPSISFASPFAYPTQTSRVANPQNASIEWLDKNHTDDQWQMNIEYDMYGGGSRNFIKKNLKVKFRDNLDGDLEFDLFDGLDYKGVRRVFKFAAFNLRGGSYDSLIGTSIAPTTYIRGLFYEYTNNDLGVLIPRGRMVHVFFNTQYEGIINMKVLNRVLVMN